MKHQAGKLSSMCLNYAYLEIKSCHFSAFFVFPRDAMPWQSDKNSINMHESRFSKSTEWIKSKNISFERLVKGQGS